MKQNNFRIPILCNLRLCQCQLFHYLHHIFLMYKLSKFRRKCHLVCIHIAQLSISQSQNKILTYQPLRFLQKSYLPFSWQCRHLLGPDSYSLHIQPPSQTHHLHKKLKIISRLLGLLQQSKHLTPTPHRIFH